MDYQEYGLTLTKGQAEKLQRAAAKGCPVSIRLSHANLSGNHRMLLTHRQLQKIQKLLQSGKGGMTLELSSKQVKQNVTKLGGFLPMLAGLAASALPVLAKTVLPALGVGALSGLGSAAISKAVGSGLYLKRGGKVCCVTARGKGLHLKSASLPQAYGDGLYLKHGRQFYDGSGLILGPNSPFKNVPLLGMLL